MNTRDINEINFWNADGIKQADKIMLYNFHGYNFDGTDSRVSYRIGYYENTDNDTERWHSLYEGSVNIPNSVVQSWGEDDEPIFDYVIDQLNLEYAE